MARPTLEAQALVEINELTGDLSDEAAIILTWAESELTYAKETYDKARQSRIATLAISAGRIMRATGQIQQAARAKL